MCTFDKGLSLVESALVTAHRELAATWYLSITVMQISLLSTCCVASRQSERGGSMCLIWTFLCLTLHGIDSRLTIIPAYLGVYADRHADKQAHKQTHKQTNKQTTKKTNNQATNQASNQPTNQPTNQASKQASKQTNKQTNGRTDGRTDVHMHTVVRCGWRVSCKYLPA